MNAHPRRIHIVGGPGSGKSTLARELGDCLQAPVYHLDRVAFEGVDFVTRPLAARQLAVREIAARPKWIAEGLFLGWTDELLEAADAIIWLDHLNWPLAWWRIVIRFARGGMEEAKRQPGIRKFSRFGDYTRHTRQLVGVLRSSREYYTQHTPDGQLDMADTRPATAAHLSAYEAKVIRCATAREVEELVPLILKQTRE